MPYNNYYPVTYQNPYSYPTAYQPFMQQTMQNQQQIPAVQSQPSQTIIWVSGDNEAAMYPIAPNSAVTLWSQSEPVVYLKQADASGKPTLKIYDLVERSEKPSAASEPADSKQSTYATKEELTAIVAAMNSMGVLLSSIKTDIGSMREDLGMTGKRTRARKTEETDE